METEDFVELSQPNYPAPLDNPDYLDIFDFEKIDFEEWRLYMGRKWHVTIHIVFIYAMVIFFGQIYMSRRQPFKLKKPLILWNFTIGIFSIVGMTRTLPEMIHLLKNVPNGLYISVCSREHFNTASAFWSLIGTWSKIPELVDTYFIILRKRPLIFLHYYHHATVLLYTWSSYQDQDPCHRWFVFMNYMVHSFMYTYYGVRSMGIRVPQIISMGITVLQIIQMVMGTLLSLYSFWIKYLGIECTRLEKNMNIALFIYVTYLLLFSQFFFKAYFGKKKEKTS